MRSDDASVHVLEAMLLAAVLLGAAHSVATLRANDPQSDRPRAHLERVARDAMVILGGLEDANGTLLDAYLQEAFHCAASPAPSKRSCEGTRGANLSLKLDSYLPPGAGYAVALDNGVEAHDLHRSTLPPGETVSASFSYVPSWNFTMLVPELSCHEPGMAANVTAVPLRRGGLAPLPAFSLRAERQAEPAVALPAHLGGLWNVTLPADALAPTRTVTAEAISRGMALPGTARLSTCDLGGRGPALVEALRATRLVLPARSAPVGTEAAFAVDLAPLAASGLTLTQANVTVYEPLPPWGQDPDAQLVAARLDLDPQEGQGNASWSVPADARLGAHPVVLRAGLRTPEGQAVEARVVDVLHVALPDGTVPIAPSYRAVLQVWFSDWR